MQMCPTAAVSVVPERERPELDAVLASSRTRRRPIPGSRRRAIFPFYCCWQSGSWRPGAAGKKASHVEDRFPGASHPAQPPLTSSHAQHLEHHHESHWKSHVAIIQYSRNTILFRDGCKSRNGAGEPRVATNQHLPNIPFEGVPLPLRQRDRPG